MSGPRSTVAYHGRLTPEAAAFARNLRGRRVAAGISQRELSQRAGYHWDVCRRYEAGERVPNVDRAARLAQALGVTVDALLEPA